MTPQGAVTLNAAQLARLDKAIIARPSRTYEDPYGNTRLTQPVINEFASSLLRYHNEHKYLTAKQYAAIKHITGD